jgi:hypothetical protein
MLLLPKALQLVYTIRCKGNSRGAYVRYIYHIPGAPQDYCGLC